MKTRIPFSRIYLAGFATLFLLSASLASAQFVDVSSQVGLSTEKKKSWGSPVWGDINHDGFLDLIVPTHGLTASGGPFVYVNNAGNSFADIRATSNIQQAPDLDSTDWHGYAFGDYDADGNLDVYIAEGATGNHGGADKRDLLFHSNGDGTFTNVSEAAGILVNQHRGRCALWFDFDQDGKLDLLVKNYGDVNDLYKNNGNGTFTLVPGAAGLADATGGVDFGSIMAMADYDNDGFLDFAFTGDSNALALYRHTSDGTYVDVTTAAGFTPVADSKGIAWGDYNNDGLIDLYIARGQAGGLSTAGTLFRNNGNGTFTDATSAAGFPSAGNFWTPLWGDYDNDGYLDLFITNPGDRADGVGNANRLYHNNGNGTFTEVGAAQGVALQDDLALHKTAAWADFNNDGFLDLLVKNGIGDKDNGPEAVGTHVLLKNTPNANHFLKINLQGVQSNLHGIGARVTVTTSTGLTCYRQATGDAGGNHYSQSSGPLHVGIGSASQAAVTIAWPSGIVSNLPNVPANSTITAVESTPTPTPTPTPAPPVITRQPANRRVVVGQSARFVVKATSDTRLSYQWKKDGSDIAGATKSSYSTPPATLADNGSNFAAVVTNTGGSVTSQPARLTVNPAAAPAPAAPSP